MNTPIKTHDIRKVAVLGSGVMGSAIACHLAQTGSDVLLLDLPSKEGPRNAPAEGALKASLKSKPAPLYSKRFTNRIECGNFDDDFAPGLDMHEKFLARLTVSGVGHHCIV